MGHPRPLDKFVWVQRTTDDGVVKQKIIPRGELPSLSPDWERIYDPTKKPEAAAESSEADDTPPAKKAAKKPSTAAESAPEKE